MLNYVALILLVFVTLIIFYGIIAIHDIPYEISKKRNHPHQDAINVAGWVSLFTLHVIWPFLWIWAALYRDDRGWGFARGQSTENVINRLEDKIQDLSNRLTDIESSVPQSEVNSSSVTNETTEPNQHSNGDKVINTSTTTESNI